MGQKKARIFVTKEFSVLCPERWGETPGELGLTSQSLIPKNWLSDCLLIMSSIV